MELVRRYICTFYSNFLGAFIFQEGWGYDFRRNMSVSWSDYGKYATDIFTDEAVEAINNHGNMNTSQPLFLYLAHLAVHSANTVMSQIIALSVVNKAVLGFRVKT